MDIQATAPNNVSVLVLGESHTRAIGHALYKHGPSDFRAIDVRSRDESGKVSTGIDFSKFEGATPQCLVVAFGGTEYNRIGMIDTDPKFDFAYPPYDEIQPGRQSVPAAMIESMLRYYIQSGLRRAQSVQDRFDCACFCLVPPPPFRELDDRVTLPRAYGSLKQSGLAPASLRRKLHFVQTRVMREEYARHGIIVLSPPEAALDDEGYLLRNMWDEDPTHGNQAYGQLVVAQIKEQLNV